MTLDNRKWSEKLQKAWLNSMLMKYTTEQRISTLFTLSCITIFFCVAIGAAGIQNSALKGVAAGLRSYRQIIIVIGILHMGACWLLQLACLGSSIFSRPSNTGLYRISIYMTVSFVYIVYPLLAWAYSSLICSVVRNEQTPAVLAVVSLFVGLATLVCVIELSTRNNVPSRFQLSAINRHTELLTFFTCIVMIKCTQLLYLLESVSVRITFFSISNLFLVGIILKLAIQPTFWQPYMNRYYMFAYLTFLLAKIVSEDLWNVSQASLFISVFLTGTMSFKLSSLAVRKQLKIDLHSKTISDFQRYYGGLMMYVYLSEDIHRWTATRDREIYTHYMGIWFKEKYGKWKPGAYRSANYGICQAELFDFLIRYFSEQDKTSLLFIKALLKIQLLKDLPSLKDLRGILSRFEGRRVKAGLLDKFELFHFRKLYERKLEAIYKGRISPQEMTGKSLNFYGIYDHMLLAYQGSVKNEIFLDVKSVFTYAEVSKAAKELIIETLNGRAKVFRSLLKSSLLSGKKLYSQNASSVEVHSKILTLFQNFHLQAASPPTYQYAVFLFYFSAVRHSFLTATGLLKAYKFRLSTIFNSLGKQKFEEDSNSVTLQIDLSSEKCGTIIETSLNYFEFLGHTASGQAEGRNIHELLPESFSKKHKQAMEAFSSQSALTGHPEEVFLVGFDGALKNAKIVLKVLPSIKKNVSAVAQLWFSKSQNESLVLVDRQMEIINAEKDFWDFFDSIDVEEKIHNLNQLTNTLKLSLFLVSRLPKIQELITMKRRDDDSYDKNVCSPSDAYLEAALKVTKELAEDNKRQGVSYVFEKESPYYKKSARESFVARHSYHEALGLPIIKVIVKLPSVHRQKLKSTKSPNKLKTTRSPVRDQVPMQPFNGSSSRSSSKNSNMSNGSDESFALSSFDDMARIDFEKIIKPATKLLTRWKNAQLSQLVNPRKDLKFEPIAETEMKKLETIHVNQIYEAIMDVFVKDEDRKIVKEKGNFVLAHKLIEATPKAKPIEKNFLRSSTKAEKMFKKAAQLKTAKVFTMEDSQPTDNLVSHNLDAASRKPSRQAAISVEAQALQLYEERELRRTEQERMENSSNIVIASSNSIAKILNKVMVAYD